MVAVAACSSLLSAQHAWRRTRHQGNGNLDVCGHVYQVRLVSRHRGQLLEQTHAHLAHQFEVESNFKLADHHYIRAHEWKTAVNRPSRCIRYIS